MKVYIVAAFLLVTVVATFAAPVEEPEPLYEGVEAEERADRQRRVTCDLLDLGGLVGHSACAANCLSMGKAGGACEDGICVCRKKTFKDLWTDRFG